MKDFLHLRMLALVAATVLALCPRAGAQGFGLSVASSTNIAVVNNPVTYAITVTNQTGLLLTNVFVTNTFSAPFQFGNVFTNQGSVFTNATSVLFALGQVTNGNSVLMVFSVKPTTAGFFTNTIAVAAAGVTNTATTNLVTQVFTAQADLGVTIAGPVQAVITNDWMTYIVTATNAGPNAAPNVVLTNTLPPGVILISPTDLVPPASSNLTRSLGTMPSGGYTNLQFMIQPTNAGLMTLSASIGSPGLFDPNPANNSASTNIMVTNYLSGVLVAVTNTAQNVNFQNGLEEQCILLTNAGGIDVPAVRVVVTGLTNRLFNAVGTNNGTPFVYYSTGLTVGQSVTLRMQYAPRGSFPFTNGQLHAFAVPVPNWTPPPASAASTNVNFSRIVRLSDGSILIEWPASTNRTYTVVYSDNVIFSNAMMAPPSVVAPANQTQWIDYGPPTTVSAPTNNSSRYYRVFLNP